MTELALAARRSIARSESPAGARVGFAVAILVPLAVVYACLVLSAAIARPLSDLGGVPYNLVCFATSAALCLAPLAVWPFRARSFALTAGLGLVVLAFVNLVHVFEYSELVTIGAFDAVFSTSDREAGEYLASRQQSVVLALLASAVALGAAVWGARQIPSVAKVTRGQRGGAAALGAVGLAVLVLFPMRLFPVSTVKNAADYAVYRSAIEDARLERADHSFGATASRTWDHDPVVVVVVGESLQRQRLGVYGYGRDTTPWLSGSEDIVVFTDAVTGAPVTQPAVAMMMSSASPETIHESTERSWLAMAEEVGFDTVWLSNQDRTDGTDMALIADDAQRVVYTSHSWSASEQLDEDVLPELDRVLEDRDGPLAIVIHLMGSHDDYALRYPARFAQFDDTPPGASGLSADQQRMIGYYDNSVGYTDWVLKQIFGRVEATGAPAVGVFAADHGENLYDTTDRMRGHGVPGTTRFEIEVPLVVWTNDRFRAARPDVLEAVGRTRDLPVTTADLFYGLADLVGATWSGDQPRRSIFDAAYEPSSRTVLLPTLEVVDAEALGVRSAE